MVTQRVGCRQQSWYSHSCKAADCLAQRCHDVAEVALLRKRPVTLMLRVRKEVVRLSLYVCIPFLHTVKLAEVQAAASFEPPSLGGVAAVWRASE
eukprot:1177301-Amphidinium_carterae.1